MIVVVEISSAQHFIGRPFDRSGFPSRFMPVPSGESIRLRGACRLVQSYIGGPSVEIAEIEEYGEGSMEIVPVMVRYPFEAEAKLYRDLEGRFEDGYIGLGSVARANLRLDDPSLRLPYDGP